MTDNINYKHIVNYLNETLPKGSGILGELEDYAFEHCTPIIQREVRCLLEVLLRYKNAKKILEIGTAIGYSAIFFAQTAGEDAEIVTLEKDADYISRAKENIKRSGYGDRITLIEGEAEESVLAVDGEFDIIFADANKSKYRYYFDVLFPHLKNGGLFICDNILYKGMISNNEFLSRKQQTIVGALRDFLPYITNHPGLCTSIIPIGDGVSVSVKI